MSKNRREPEIRFPGFDGEWEQRKVSEITAFHKQGFYTTEAYDDEKKYYLLRGTDLTENKLVLKDTPKINATEKDYHTFKTQIGDFLIVRSGTVGTYGIVYEDIPAIFGSYLIDFRFDKSLVTNEFFGYFYQSDLFKNQLKQIIQQSANTNINAENIKSTSIKLPSIPEQRQIGTFFDHLDNLITLYQRKCEEAKEFKKSMLQKMFPKRGESVPEIRFPGFTGEWESKKIGDFTVRTKERNKSNLDLNPFAITNNHGFIAQNEAHDTFGYMKNVDRRTYVIVKPNSFAYNPSRINVGSLGYYNGTENVIISPLYEVFQTTEIIDDIFLKHWFKTENFMNWIEYLQEGSVRLSFNYDKLQECIIKIPSIAEQKKIASCFENIDSLISFYQNKIDEIKKYKKGLLQKMFV